MVPLAEEVERAHLTVVRGAVAPEPDPFPPSVVRGLWLGIAFGALAGLVIGSLLFEQVFTVPGWEGLFSMGPFTFLFFSTMIGAAAGILVGGIGAILVASPD